MTSRLALFLGMLLAFSPLRADEKRMFANNSDAPWVLELLVRDQKEKANLKFRLDGKETVLGEDSALKAIVLPPYSRFEVEFTHASRAFHHAFLLRDSQGGQARFAADHAWPVLSMKARAPVELAYLGGTLPDLAALAPYLTINAPVLGDLTINRSFLGAKPTHGQTFSFVNRTDAVWRVEPAGLKEVEDLGGMTVALDNGTQGDLTALGGIKIPAKARLKVQFRADGDGRFDQTFRISNSQRGAWVLRVTGDAGKAYPDHVAIQPIQGDLSDPWVFYDRFARDGYLDIEDPDKEAAVSIAND